ncbi:unnamed protein product, partial [Polarella glacialis]
WGLAEDKPFKPLPYVDLPVGLDEHEVDQFLREQRLEDLHRKIQACRVGMLKRRSSSFKFQVWPWKTFRAKSDRGFVKVHKYPATDFLPV